MQTQPATSDDTASPSAGRRALFLGCIGVVYGDIGTSPLYAFREAAKNALTGGAPAQEAVYGVLSLIVWSLAVIVTLKYVYFLLRADNKGEGGILSLMALAQKAVGRKYGLIFYMGMAGAALFYGDAAITPAISVLSAVEGLSLVTPAFDRFVLPLSLAIIVLLFISQRKGTAKVSSLFGPVMILWFATIGIVGILHIIANPSILYALSPVEALRFLFDYSGIAFVVLGAVFLAVTGAEALYADLGHFGSAPIRQAWLWIVFPCLVLNYLGQGAFILASPDAIENPFFLMAPEWGLLPLVILATMATIIASQAVITGAFSLTRQAIQLGLLPRLEIRHMSAEHEGQIYMPKINAMLMLAVLFLCLIFRTSGALASAYGIAVTGTMVVTTILAFVVTRHVWKKSRLFSLALVIPFFAIEGVFLFANLQKVMDGGYVPLAFAGVLVLMMATWVRGTRHLYQQAHRTSVMMSDLLEILDRDPPKGVPGTAIFMTSDPLKAPVALLQNLRHNKILHEHNIILTVVTTHTPRVHDEQRAIVERLSSHFTRVILIFGYAETPNVPRTLRLIRHEGLTGVDFHDASFFLGRRTIMSSSAHKLHKNLARAWQEQAAPPKKHGLFRRRRKQYAYAHVGLPEWQDQIYISMAHAAVTATDFFSIPRSQVVEMGTQMAV